MQISSPVQNVTANADSSEVISAKLVKNQVIAQGQQALALIDSAAMPAQTQSRASSPTATLGNNIDVYV